MKRYRLLSKKGEGTFSEVLKAQSIKTGRYVAVKCMKAKFTSLEQVNNLREIQALRRLSPHPNVVGLIEVLFDKTGGRLALVFELMSLNLYELIRGRRRHLASGLVKVYMFQTLRALAHMHEKGVMHRDIKPENVLVESSYDVYSGLKLADFGSCRGIYSRQPYTEYISTRWYRAPECLLTDGYYGREMDVWGVGSVFYELCALRPLFPGENEKDMVRRIHEVLGTPTDKTLQFLKRHASRHMDLNFAPVRGKGLASMIPGHVPVQMVDLLLKMLQYDPRRRITAKEALMHPYFADLRRTEVPAELKSKYPQAFDSPEVQPASAQSSKRGTSGKKASGGGSKSGAAASSTATVEGKESESSKKRGADPSSGTKHHSHTSSTTSSGSGTGSTHHGSTTAQKQKLEEQARRRAKAASDKLARDLARAEAAKAAKAAKEADEAVAAVAAAVKPKHSSHVLEEEGVDSGSPNDRKKRSKRLYDGKGTVQPQTLKSTGQTSLFAAARARRGSVGDADEVVDEVNDGGGRQGSDKHGGGGHGASHGGATHGQQFGRSHHHQSAARMGAVGGQQPAVTRRPRGLRRRFGPGSSGAGGTGTSVGGAGGGVTGASVALSPSTTRTVAGGSSLRHGAHGAGQLSSSTSRIAQGARPLYGVGATGAAPGASGTAGMSVMGSGGAGGGASSGLRSGAGAARRAVGRPYLGGGAGGGVSGYGGGSTAARRAARYGGGGAVSAARRRQGGVTGGGYGASSGGGFSYGGAGRAAGAGWRRR